MTHYYIRNTKSVVGNCALWWAEGGHGYTSDLDKAWCVTEAKAREICRNRPEQDVAYPLEMVNRAARRHVDVQSLAEHERFRKPGCAVHVVNTPGCRSCRDLTATLSETPNPPANGKSASTKEGV